MAVDASGGSVGYEPVIGLEVHCELATATKLFCSCPNSFGDEPNTNVCPVCLALPGSLPVLNERAVDLAIRVGLALHSDVRQCTFHRKNYFYPDMPKDYQISQYDEPLNAGGWLDLPSGTRVGVTRAHLEEDTGKTVHMGGTGRIHDATFSLVDYNRAGVPLLEIVSEPDIRSPQEAREYVAELRAILVAAGASKARMEEGSMRVDVNISVRPAGSASLATRCEIKNLNSLRSLVRALEYEIARQAEVYRSGGSVVQEPRHFDEDTGRTASLRSKEEAHDYRYFEEPDLLRLVPGQERVDAIAAGLPAMPAQRRSEIAALFSSAGAGTGGGAGAGGAREDQIAGLVENGLDGLLLAAVNGGVSPEKALARTANEAASRIDEALALDPESYGRLLVMEEAGKLTATQVKAVLSEMLDEGRGDPAAIAKRLGFETMGAGSINASVEEVVASNAAEWDRYCSGEDKLAQFFIGQVMKATRGKADGKAVVAELQRLRSTR